MLIEYRNRQYEIDGSWNSENGVLSVWFPLKAITEDHWKEREESLRAYIGHHMAENATISTIELLDTDLPNITTLGGSETRLAVLQAHYEPREVEDFDEISGGVFAAFGMPAPSPEVRLRQDIQEHALSSAGRGIELTFHGFLLFRSAADARSTEAA